MSQKQAKLKRKLQKPIDLSQCPLLKCGKCDGVEFVRIYVNVLLISALISHDGQEHIAAQEHYKCLMCGAVMGGVGEPEKTEKGVDA